MGNPKSKTASEKVGGVGDLLEQPGKGSGFSRVRPDKEVLNLEPTVSNYREAPTCADIAR
jgi:hypothetical protein